MREELDYENNRRIGSKHCIGEYFILSYGDVCPFYADGVQIVKPPLQKNYQPFLVNGRELAKIWFRSF